MKSINIFAVLFEMLRLSVLEKWISYVATVAVKVKLAFTEFVLPIYSAPFLGLDIKPPAA